MIIIFIRNKVVVIMCKCLQSILFNLYFSFLLIEPPKIVISPKDQTFTEGSEVSIKCSTTGYPKPTVVWTHNEMFIIGSNR